MSITENDFISDLSKRIFLDLVELKNKNADYDISLLQSNYNNKEIGYITSLSLKNTINENYEKLLEDSIKVLNEEKLKITDTPVDAMGEEDWTSFMNNLIEKKVKKDG